MAAVGLFGGQYKDAETNSSATVTVVEGEPALFLPVITSEGTDYLDTIRQALGLGYKGFGAFLYPMGLVSFFFVVLLWFGGRLLTDFAGQRRQDCVPRDVGCARQDGAPRVRELGRARPREVWWVSGGSVYLSCWKGRQGDGVGDSPHGQDYAQGLGVVRGEGPGQWTGDLVIGGGNLYIIRFFDSLGSDSNQSFASSWSVLSWCQTCQWSLRSRFHPKSRLAGLTSPKSCHLVTGQTITLCISRSCSLSRQHIRTVESLAPRSREHRPSCEL